MITVILNCYKRPQYLQEQIEAIRSQTILTEDILVWSNKPEDQNQQDLSHLGVKTIMCNHNFKFHGRFTLGLLAKTKYVAFFDDDTIPGNKWFENCINTIEQGQDGILGTTGVYLLGDNYNYNTKFGWNGKNNPSTTEVDLVGHAWFMKKDYLRYLWYEDPVSWNNGEDMQLSYQAQKYGNIKTYVPPHPPEDTSIWGSLPKTGVKYGSDKAASWIHNSDHGNLRDEIVQEQIKRGWKLCRNN